MGFSFLVRGRTRTHPNATRMSVARCGWTQRNLYFLPKGRKCKSSPVSATKKDSQPLGWLSFLFALAELVMLPPGYETDERSSLGERGERRRWREERPERVAAVGEGRRHSCRGHSPGTATGEIRRTILCRCSSQRQKSSPVSATKKDSQPLGWLSFLFALAELVMLPPGYETDERSSLGERGERRRWREERPERVAAVDKIEDQRKPEDFVGHRNRTPGTT